MDPALPDEMDFSFSCDKCSFSTKDMVEIKRHMQGHRNGGKDPSQMVAAVGSPDARQNDAPKDSTEMQPNHNSAQESQDHQQKTEDNPQETATTSTRETPSDTPAVNDPPIFKDKPTDRDTPTIRDTPASPPSRQHQGEGGIAPSVLELRDADGDQTKTINESKTDEGSAGVATGGAQCVGRETTVIVSRREHPLNIHKDGVQQPADVADKTKEGPGSIADRIHSRRRPTSKKPLEEYQEEEEEYVPYRRPAMHATLKVKRYRRRGKRRGAALALTKLRPAIASDRYKCQHCHFVCKFKQSLRAHVRGGHPEIYAEMTPDERKGEEGESEEEEAAGGDADPGVVDAIQSQVPPDRYQCNLCEGFFCRFKKDLHDHKSREHGVTAPPYKYQSRIPGNRYQCLECDYVCKFQRSLRVHCRSAHPKTVKSPEVKEKKEKVPVDRYQCPDCDFACKFKGQLKNHRSKLHKKERPPKAIREQQCEFCHKFIQGTTHHYRRHLKTHTGDKPYKCPVCEAVFGDQSRLNAHAPIHLEERNYLCDQCGKCFKRAINLRMHRKVHLVIRPHGCELCSYRCKRHDTLNLHMKRKHLKIRRILCHTCGKKFFSEKECQLHAARKHLPRPTPFQCTFCPLAFPFAYNLRAHMRKHPEHKPFRCDFCTFESRSKASLQDHEKMHTGEKQKKCEMCDYTTSTSSNLYKHRKRQHGIVINRSKSPRNRDLAQDGPSSLAQPMVVIQGASPQGSLPGTPQPHAMMPTPDGHPAHQMVLQGRLQRSPLPVPISQIQGTHSPSLTQSVSVATAVGHVDLRNVQAYEEIDFKDRRAIIYGREKSLIGSVITEALAEARNVVQSELFSGHMIPSTIATAGVLHHAALPVTTTMAPPHGGIVPADAIIHSAIPTSAGIPPSAAPPGMFNSIMNIHYQ